jgi:D-alanyl-D-alanine carboxypeptidase
MRSTHPSAALEALGIPTSLIAARGLLPFPEAWHLEIAETGEDGREHLLIPEAAAAWRTMRRAAHEDGIVLSIVSAYRSVERQVEIVRRKLEAGQSLEQILAVSAPPGFSEHHTGRAVDVTTPRAPILDVGFAETDAYHWLMRRAGEFHFVLSYPDSNNRHGYAFEPWHWCYEKVPTAALGGANLNNEITLRVARSEDLGFLFSLLKVALGPYIEQTYGAWQEAEQHKQFMARTRPETHQVVELAGRAVGCLAVEWLPDRVKLNRIFLLPAVQRRGIGAQLVRHVLEQARASHLPVSLRVLKVNPAQRLWRRLGFTVVGETETHWLMELPPNPALPQPALPRRR